MTTIVKLGFGVLKVTAKGVKLFTDTLIDGGKVPEMRIDEGESSGPNSDVHVHFGDGEGKSLGEGAAEFLLGAANTTNYIRKRSLQKEDYLLADEYTLKGLRRYS